jgi:hypothetical protein
LTLGISSNVAAFRIRRASAHRHQVQFTTGISFLAPAGRELTAVVHHRFGSRSRRTSRNRRQIAADRGTHRTNRNLGPRHIGNRPLKVWTGRTHITANASRSGNLRPRATHHLTASVSTLARRASRVSREVRAALRNCAASTTFRLGCTLARIEALDSSPISSGSTAGGLVGGFALAGTFSQTNALTFSPRLLHHLTELNVTKTLPLFG